MDAAAAGAAAASAAESPAATQKQAQAQAALAGRLDAEAAARHALAEAQLAELRGKQRELDAMQHRLRMLRELQATADAANAAVDASTARQDPAAANGSPRSVRVQASAAATAVSASKVSSASASASSVSAAAAPADPGALSASASASSASAAAAAAAVSAFAAAALADADFTITTAGALAAQSARAGLEMQEALDALKAFEALRSPAVSSPAAAAAESATRFDDDAFIFAISDPEFEAKLERLREQEAELAHIESQMRAFQAVKDTMARKQAAVEDEAARRGLDLAAGAGPAGRSGAGSLADAAAAIVAAAVAAEAETENESGRDGADDESQDDGDFMRSQVGVLDEEERLLLSDEQRELYDSLQLLARDFEQVEARQARLAEARAAHNSHLVAATLAAAAASASATLAAAGSDADGQGSQSGVAGEQPAAVTPSEIESLMARLVAASVKDQLAERLTPKPHSPAPQSTVRFSDPAGDTTPRASALQPATAESPGAPAGLQSLISAQGGRAASHGGAHDPGDGGDGSDDGDFDSNASQASDGRTTLGAALVDGSAVSQEPSSVATSALEQHEHQQPYQPRRSFSYLQEQRGLSRAGDITDQINLDVAQTAAEIKEGMEQISTQLAVLDQARRFASDDDERMQIDTMIEKLLRQANELRAVENSLSYYQNLLAEKKVNTVNCPNPTPLHRAHADLAMALTTLPNIATQRLSGMVAAQEAAAAEIAASEVAAAAAAATSAAPPAEAARPSPMPKHAPVPQPHPRLLPTSDVDASADADVNGDQDDEAEPEVDIGTNADADIESVPAPAPRQKQQRWADLTNDQSSITHLLSESIQGMLNDIDKDDEDDESDGDGDDDGNLSRIAANADDDSSDNLRRLFATHRDGIYRCAAKVISDFETSPYFLITLFKRLPKLSSQYARERLLIALDEIVEEVEAIEAKPKPKRAARTKTPPRATSTPKAAPAKPASSILQPSESDASAYTTLRRGSGVQAAARVEPVVGTAERFFGRRKSEQGRTPLQPPSLVSHATHATHTTHTSNPFGQLAPSTTAKSALSNVPSSFGAFRSTKNPFAKLATSAVSSVTSAPSTKPEMPPAVGAAHSQTHSHAQPDAGQPPAVDVGVLRSLMLEAIQRNLDAFYAEPDAAESTFTHEHIGELVMQINSIFYAHLSFKSTLEQQLNTGSARGGRSSVEALSGSKIGDDKGDSGLGVNVRAIAIIEVLRPSLEEQLGKYVGAHMGRSRMLLQRDLMRLLDTVFELEAIAEVADRPSQTQSAASAGTRAAAAKPAALSKGAPPGLGAPLRPMPLRQLRTVSSSTRTMSQVSDAATAGATPSTKSYRMSTLLRDARTSTPVDNQPAHAGTDLFEARRAGEDASISMIEARRGVDGTPGAPDDMADESVVEVRAAQAAASAEQDDSGDVSWLSKRKPGKKSASVNRHVYSNQIQLAMDAIDGDLLAAVDAAEAAQAALQMEFDEDDDDDDDLDKDDLDGDDDDADEDEDADADDDDDAGGDDQDDVDEDDEADDFFDYDTANEIDDDGFDAPAVLSEEVADPGQALENEAEAERLEARASLIEEQERINKTLDDMIRRNHIAGTFTDLASPRKAAALASAKGFMERLADTADDDGDDEASGVMVGTRVSASHSKGTSDLGSGAANADAAQPEASVASVVAAAAEAAPAVSGAAAEGVNA
ncbi:hypothetical protein HK105_200336 [Polyrhizophydium stewartii]|uniref:Pericentriolar material 1 protein C-terminal domain-containing protein n=1 Tax=Polyrhizophydium stewartii TaxID=2732419 RepID=A0ABR4NLC3_9FUNG